MATSLVACRIKRGISHHLGLTSSAQAIKNPAIADGVECD